MKRLRQIVEWGFLLPVPLISLGWLFGWLARDRSEFTSWFYFIPAPVVVVLGALWFLFTKRSVSRRLRQIVALLSLLALGKMLLTDFAWHRARVAPAGSLRVVHWNAAHTVFGLVPVMRTVQQDHPDVLLLSEALYSQDLARFAARELGLPHAFQDQTMALLARYPLEPRGTIPIANGRAWWARLQTPRGPLDVVAVDLYSRPDLNRRLPLDRIAAWTAEHEAAVPLLILGDFNTPRDARVFRPLREHMTHAYETAGHGWPYSWPLPLPVYALDHAWVSSNLVVHTYRLRAAPISDHLRQVMDVTLSP